MKWLRCAVVCYIAMIVPVLGADPEPKILWKPSPERGEQLSVKLCQSCHDVRPGAPEQSRSNGVTVGIPSFAELAGLPDQRISNTLIKPHMPMPDLQLTRNEIADILAYFEALRRKAGDKPAAPATDAPDRKPRYPAPS
ncbi:MAG: c-type cytochrome [Alphaproteobacteria bacterium]|nr:c-type cytochrome [Alphaproteobacteria bacterium]